MGKFTRAIEKRYSLADLDRDMDALVYGQDTFTGVKISERTALKSVPYFHGVRLISETFGMVPLPYYKRVRRGLNSTRGGKEKAVEENNYWLLHEEPNPEMDAIAFKAAMCGQAVVWGDSYAEIDWDMEAGMARALWPLDVSRMKPVRNSKTRELEYAYTTPDNITHVLPAWRVWHMAGFGFNGITGFNNVEQSREALGLTMALEEHAARLFGNSARPDIVLTHPNHLEKPAKDHLKQGWQEAYGGLSNAHRTAILDEGITIKEIGLPPQTAQQLEHRTFQIQEISRMLNVTPHKLMELSHATFTNIEHQDLEFLKYTMGIWFRRGESASNRKLILPADRRLFFYEFLEDALLRSDSTARANFYRELFYLGMLSPNDGREKENMNPIDDPMADEYFVQRNMIPLKMADDVNVIAGGRNTDRQGAADRNSLADITARIAAREKSNIQKAAARYSKEELKTWLGDFYRDFPEYIKAQVRPVLGDRAGAVEDYVKRYVKNSQEFIEGAEEGKLGEAMAEWEQMKGEEI
jgi:HK97 family phage portal protein